MTDAIKTGSMTYKQQDKKVDHDSCREAHGVKMIGGIPCVGRGPSFGTIPTKEWNKMVAKARDDNYTVDNKSERNTVKHTLWWKIGIILSFIGTLLSYTILIGMGLWMIFQE